MATCPSLYVPWFFPGLRRRVAAWSWFPRWSFRIIVVTLVMLVLGEQYYDWRASKFDMSALGQMPERTIVYNSQGKEIGRLHGQNRVIIKLKNVAPFFIEALLAREDNDFYNHGGIAWRGVARALFRRVTDGATQGASTITMQLARNSFGLMNDKSIDRKFLEIGITRRIESNFTKDEILEFYLNRIFFGTGIYGLERASQAYFGKPAKDMAMDESAMLVAIIRGPNIFSPFRHYDVALSGRNMVLDRMVTSGRLSTDEANKLKSVRTKVLAAPEAGKDSWAMDAVRRDLERVLDGGDVDDGGLKVFTTLDSTLQAAAERAVETEMTKVENQRGFSHQRKPEYEKLLVTSSESPPEYLQAAVMVLDNTTGATLAIVGGRDSDHSSYNRALMARRQAGSTFKPFVYAAAVEHGLLPGAQLNDDPITPSDIRSADDPDFSPSNSDGTFQGMQRADWGLAHSRNTMAVRAGEYAGMDGILDLAKRVGLGDIQGRSAQIYLGNLGVTMEALTSAFSTFPNGGRRCRPFVIDRVEDATGQVVFRSGVIDYEAIKPGAAWMVTGMMERTCGPGGTASAVRKSGIPGLLGGKTGTTDDYRDAWFVGFNPRITCGVWVGFDDPKRIIAQGYGSRLALPVWMNIMHRAIQLGYRGDEWLHPPLREIDLCAVSGTIAGPACRKRIHEVVPEDCIPAIPCPVHLAR